MLFKLGDNKIEVNVEQLEPALSKRTGKELERLCFEYMIRGEEANAVFLNQLEQVKSKGVDSIDGSDNPLKHFEITNNSYIYSGHTVTHDTIFTHIIELKEEDLKVEALVLNGQEFALYSYREHYNDSALLIQAKVRLSDAQLEKLKALLRGPKYFSVIRKGSNDEPLTMRFGNCHWSQDQEFTKYELNLVEQSHDQELEDTAVDNNELELLNLQNALAVNNNFVQELAVFLVNKKVITMGELNELKKKANEKAVDAIRDLYKVEDIDQ